MRLKLVTLGKLKDPAMRALVEDYLRRLRRRYEVAWLELRREPGTLARAEAVRREGHRILEATGQGTLVLLEETGELLDSKAFARKFERLMASSGSEIVFAVGGPYGHGPEVRQRAQWRWSLSPLTFSHQLVPALVAEQLYRADSILHGEPYHHD